MKLFAFCVEVSACDQDVFAVVAETAEQAREMIRAEHQNTQGEPYPYELGEPDSVQDLPALVGWTRSFD